MLLVHPTASHMPPPTPTCEVLPDVVEKFNAVIDTVRTNTDGFYHCEYNEKAKGELAQYFTSTKKWQQDCQVGLTTLSLMIFTLLALQ